jgi:retinal rod rhodopsin-sensitive cGMP 3',5'-cyclic phosphodiesterase subunit delta
VYTQSIILTGLKSSNQLEIAMRKPSSKETEKDSFSSDTDNDLKQPSDDSKYRKNDRIDDNCAKGYKESACEVDDSLSYQLNRHADVKDGDDGSDDEIEAEFQRLTTENAADIVILSENFMQGFRINSMQMRDGHTGKHVWTTSSPAWSGGYKDIFKSGEIEERVPKDILRCRSVSREMVFSSREKIKDFRIEQKILFRGACIEEWFFHFGFVIPGSTNSWEQTIEAAAKDKMMAAEVLSGNMVIETSFFDASLCLGVNRVRIFYV